MDHLAVQGAASAPPPSLDDAWQTALEEHLERGDFDLPMLPRVATEVVRVSAGSDGDASRLAHLIHQDPALAGNVLRVANSPAYLPRTPIVSLQQAVTRLGFVALGEIALAASLQSGVFRVGRHEAALQELWRHALASGGWAREIARHKRANVENAFLCGLLHGIGKPALLQMVANLEREWARPIPPAALAEILDVLHVRIGAALADRWQLPSGVQNALAHYRDVGFGADDQAAVEVVVTATASRLATHLLAPDILDEETLRAHAGFAALNLYPEDVDALLERREIVRDLVASMTL
jgi:HD-like signal output (HDOD) protein